MSDETNMAGALRALEVDTDELDEVVVDDPTALPDPAASTDRRRLVALAVVLFVSAALIAVGVALTSLSAGLVVAGVLLAGWSWLVLGETT